MAYQQNENVVKALEKVIDTFRDVHGSLGKLLGKFEVVKERLEEEKRCVSNIDDLISQTKDIVVNITYLLNAHEKSLTNTTEKFSDKIEYIQDQLKEISYNTVKNADRIEDDIRRMLKDLGKDVVTSLSALQSEIELYRAKINEDKQRFTEMKKAEEDQRALLIQRKKQIISLIISTAVSAITAIISWFLKL